ncbi:BON domain-containing protein [Granulosicoccus sp. 3-233]|uniref:BON domain-containing protein n=1 Tax=Granulosicoccus sp. 3-233 TaxID=3417969 RepID=UPI003D3405C5
MNAFSSARHGLLIGLLLMNAACTTVTREIDQVDAMTAQRTTEVKSALIASTEVDAAAIRVSTRDDGALLLSGFVETEKERQAALKAARDAFREGRVIDELELR